MDTMNQTIQRVTNQNFFPEVKIGQEIESFVVACLLLIGLFRCQTSMWVVV